MPREKMAAFQRGLRDDEFVKNLIIDPSSDFADLAARTQRFMAIKRLTGEGKRHRGRTSPGPRKIAVSVRTSKKSLLLC